MFISNNEKVFYDWSFSQLSSYEMPGQCFEVFCSPTRCKMLLVQNSTPHIYIINIKCVYFYDFVLDYIFQNTETKIIHHKQHTKMEQILSALLIILQPSIWHTNIGMTEYKALYSFMEICLTWLWLCHFTQQVHC